MKRLLIGIMVTVMMNEVYCEPSAPDVGVLYNTKDAASLVYKCQNKDELLECEFTQSSVRKSLKPENVQQAKKEMLDQYERLKRDATKESCNKLQALFDRADEKNRMPKEVFQRAGKLLLEFCLNSSKSNFNNLVDVVIDDQTRTCLIGANTFHQTFKKHFDYKTGNTTWIVKDEPTGECGIIAFSRFEIDQSAKDFTAWKYFSRKAITNPKAKIMGDLSCSALDETEYEYDWKHNARYMKCDIIEFSVF